MSKEVKEPKEPFNNKDGKFEKAKGKSVSYALKAINNHVETLTKSGLLSEESAEIMYDKVHEAASKFIKTEYGIG